MQADREGPTRTRPLGSPAAPTTIHPNRYLIAETIRNRARHHRCTRATSVSTRPDTPPSPPYSDSVWPRVPDVGCGGIPPNPTVPAPVPWDAPERESSPGGAIANAQVQVVTSTPVGLGRVRRRSRYGTSQQPLKRPTRGRSARSRQLVPSLSRSLPDSPTSVLRTEFTP